ncbi:MAG TPA: DUF3379 family protein [Usitatibacter sp.]|nr:DUF3379 family protein [Usitatibacter sp.]
MNEIEARRALLSDPRRLAPELAEAIARDARLAAVREELLRADDDMKRALTAAPVPEGLAERIVLRARYGAGSRWGLALAAAAAALAIALPSYLDRFHRARALEIARDEAMLRHVAESTGELEDDGHVEPAAFRASVARLGVPLRLPGYRVRHLANCVIAGVESRHFVIDGPRGPVSYVILPGALGDAAMRTLEWDGMRGVFTQRAGATIGAFATAGSVARPDLERLLLAVAG